MSGKRRRVERKTTRTEEKEGKGWTETTASEIDRALTAAAKPPMVLFEPRDEKKLEKLAQIVHRKVTTLPTDLLAHQILQFLSMRDLWNFAMIARTSPQLQQYVLRILSQMIKIRLPPVDTRLFFQPTSGTTSAVVPKMQSAFERFLDANRDVIRVFDVGFDEKTGFMNKALWRKAVQLPHLEILKTSFYTGFYEDYLEELQDNMFKLKELEFSHHLPEDRRSNDMSDTWADVLLHGPLKVC